MVLLLLTLLTVAEAGSVTTSEGFQFFWNVTDTNLTVVLMMPQGLADTYEYWGVGFKNSDARVDMQHSNLWTVTVDGSLYDTWSMDNIKPSYPGEGHAHLVFHVNQSGNFYTKITRFLQPAGSYEYLFTPNASLLVTYAFGTISSGRLMPHSTHECGGVTITLDNRYVVSYVPTSSVLLTVAVVMLGCLALC